MLRLDVGAADGGGEGEGEVDDGVRGEGEDEGEGMGESKGEGEGDRVAGGWVQGSYMTDDLWLGLLLLPYKVRMYGHYA